MGGLPYRSEEDRAAVARFWEGREAARPLFEQVARRAQEWGPFEVVGSHSRVLLVAGTRFVWCPVAHADGRLALRFLLPRAVASPRLRTDRLGGRWSHRVALAGPADLDKELLGWLREAYEWARHPSPA
ncbi:MAG: hypothetical protein QOG31_171 [Thermoplasmata archaeon]|nr:hypothetical protein [Thermoplasmata archaeon]